MATNLQVARKAAEILTEETGEKHTASLVAGTTATIWNGGGGNVARITRDGVVQGDNNNHVEALNYADWLLSQKS